MNMFACIPALATLCALAGLMFGCQPSEMTADAQTGLSIIRFSEDNDPKSLDPFKSGDVVSSRLLGLLYEELFEYDLFANPARLQPALAAGFPEVSEDKLTYTFTVRDDVYFHDDPCFPGGKGRKMTAHDVEYSIKRLCSLGDTQGYWIYQGRIVGIDEWRTYLLGKIAIEPDATKREAIRRKAFERPIPGIEVLDSHRVRVQLTEPYPQFLYALAMHYGSVMPHEAADYYRENLHFHPVGTGPFMLEQWNYKKEIVFTKNPKYRDVRYPEPPATLDDQYGMAPREQYLPYVGRRLPLADKIIVRIIRETQAAWLELLAGNLDFEGSVGVNQFTQAIQGGKLSPALAQKGVKTVKYVEPTIDYLAFNMENAVIGSPAGEKGRALRRAISMAFDRQSFIQRYKNDCGTAAGQLIPPGTSGFRPNGDMSHCVYDPEKARAELRAGGFDVSERSGKWSTIDPATGEQAKVMVLLRNEAAAAEARFLEYTGNDIGIALIGDPKTFNEWQTRTKNGDFQATFSGWVMDYPDAQNNLMLLYGANVEDGTNTARYRSDQYDAMYKELVSLIESDPVQLARKMELIDAMHRLIEHDAPWAPIFYRTTYEFHNYWHSPVVRNSFAYNFMKYYHSGTMSRAQSSQEWAKRPILPAILILGSCGLLLALFAFRIARGR